MNNALYPLLCEEARASCAARNAYVGRAATLASAHVVAVSVSYVGQARAFSPLEVSSHCVGDAFHCEVRSESRVVAQVVLATAGGRAAHARL